MREYTVQYLNAKGKVKLYSFEAENIEEAYIMMLHTSPTFDKVADAGTIKELMKEAAKWLVNYFTWEDHNIIREKYEQK